MTFYAGTFLVAFATLAMEVSLTRLLSVTTWYHLAFFAVSIAMLGMTAGAVTVYVRPKWFDEGRLRSSIAKACLGYALVTPITAQALCVIGIREVASVSAYAMLLVAALVSLLPFYFSGVAIGGVLTKSRLPIGRLYACDLVGASLGCVFVLWGLGALGAPNLILGCGCIGVAAALCFAGKRPPRRLRAWSLAIACVLVGLIVLGMTTSYGVRPLVAKGRPADPGRYIVDKWNSFSRVVVYGLTEGKPQLVGASRLARGGDKVFQYRMSIDGAAGTTLRRFNSVEDIDHLRYDVTNVAYYLRPGGGAFIIGVGGGRDLQSAILFGQERVVGVDINPIFINLLERRFRGFAGIADHPGVRLVADEARSYLARSTERYSVIQMSLVDTWAATGAGAYTLSENGLYTVEAWIDVLDHLSPDGIFTVSRWYNPVDLGETGRALSLGVASLLESGAADPSQHLAMITNRTVATLLIARSPLSKSDIDLLRATCDRLQYKLPLYPGRLPAHEVLDRIVSAKSRGQLQAAGAGAEMNYSPPTDENPYFFNMLRVNQVVPSFLAKAKQAGVKVIDQSVGIAYGNLVATRTLVGLIGALLALAVVTVVMPLVVASARSRGRLQRPHMLWSAAAYFSLIGAGFMFVEIALIQRLTVFLGSPMYALGVLLFTVIASAGLGSLASDRLPLTRVPWVFAYPVTIAGVILAARFVLPLIASGLMSASMATKIPVAVVTVAPVGLLLGIGFPTGMRLVRSSRAEETPWYWALNGIFSVLCSAFAVFVSIYLGISFSFYIAAACYGLLLVCLPHMRKA
ncbi:MAG: hypothetical protein WAW06_08800 [bacterium]